MIKFSVITPTFNRAELIHRVYESLQRQDYLKFEWIIVDDGSNDNTEEVIKEWASHSSFPITYYKQANKGKMYAVLEGVRVAHFDAVLVAESDDAFPDYTLRKMAEVWEEIPKERISEYSGVDGLCADSNGTLMTSAFTTDDFIDSDYMEIRYRYGVDGGTWGFVRKEILLSFSVDENLEGHIPEGILWDFIATRYKTRFVNTVFRTFLTDTANSLTENHAPFRDCQGMLLWKHTMLALETRWFWYRPFHFVLEAARLNRFLIHCFIRGKRVKFMAGLPAYIVPLIAFTMPIGLMWYGWDLVRLLPQVANNSKKNTRQGICSGAGKVLVVVGDLGLGGAERAGVTLANGLSRRGYEVELLQCYTVDRSAAYEVAEGISNRQLISGTKRRAIGPIRQIFKLLALRRELREKHDWCVIGFLTDVNLGILSAGLGLNNVTIVTEHTFPGEHKLGFCTRFLRRFLYSRSHLVVPTNDSANWFRTHLNLAGVRVIPNSIQLPVGGLGPNVDVASYVKDNELLILGVGRLSEEKQFDLLIEAVSLVSDRVHDELVLGILGEGEQRQMLAGLAEKVKRKVRVVMPGTVGNVADWYKRSNVFVVSSAYEGFSLALLEAQAHGVACVSFNCLAGPADLIEHGRTGLLVNPESGVAGLAEAIANLLSNDDKRKQIGMAAKAASQQFETSQIIAKWENLIAEIKEEKNS